jgi:hypothetical protein
VTPSSVPVPAGGTAEVTVSVDTRPAVPIGRHSGQVVASATTSTAAAMSRATRRPTHCALGCRDLHGGHQPVDVPVRTHRRGGGAAVDGGPVHAFSRRPRRAGPGRFAIPVSVQRQPDAEESTVSGLAIEVSYDDGTRGGGQRATTGRSTCTTRRAARCRCGPRLPTMRATRSNRRSCARTW